MRARHAAPTDIQRGAHNLIHSQRFRAHGRADDIHHGVDCAHLVEVHAFEIGVVNLGFRRAQRFEDSDRGALCAIADAALRG